MKWCRSKIIVIIVHVQFHKLMCKLEQIMQDEKQLNWYLKFV